MIIRVLKSREEDFCRYFLPEHIKVLYLEELAKVDKSSMDKYLTENYKLTTEKILEKVDEYLNAVVIGNNYVISFDKNKWIKKVKYITLIQLIDDGNLEVSGLNLSNKVEKTVMKNLGALYTLWKMKRKIEVNSGELEEEGEQDVD